MLKKIIKIGSVFLGGLLFILLNLTVSFAEENDANFSVGTILSEHQTDKSNSFYDIKWSPDQIETFGLRVTNNTDKEETYTIKIGKARTTTTGSINYTDTVKEYEAKKYKISDMLKIQTEVKVPANSSQTVKGTITFPSDTEYNGILIGGINVAPKKISTTNKNSPITNTISYTIPLVLRGNIDKRPIPSIKFESLTIKQLTSKNYSILVKIHNVEPTLLNGAEFKTTIKDSNDKIIDVQEDTVDITPETKFEYPIKLGRDYLSGEYSVSIVIMHKNNRWKYEHNFKITKEQAIDSKMIKPKSNISKILNNVVFWITIFILVIFSIYFLLIIRTYRKK
jgi:Bacterial protein of unknown function (DUF916)./Protein of unknown function C-terminal (DUF3324).